MEVVSTSQLVNLDANKKAPLYFSRTLLYIKGEDSMPSAYLSIKSTSAFAIAFLQYTGTRIINFTKNKAKRVGGLSYVRDSCKSLYPEVRLDIG